MTDSNLRELERRFRTSDCVEDEAAWLRARVQAGELDPASLPGLEFHDGHIESVDFQPKKRRLVLMMELSASGHPDVVDGDPEALKGSLVFTGVTNLHVEASDHGLLSRDWWANHEGQFLQAEQKDAGCRLMFEAERPGETERAFCMLDLEFHMSYFESQA